MPSQFITGKSLAAFRDRLTTGTRLRCIENTYIPHRAGLEAIVTKPGKSTVRLQATTSTGNIEAGGTCWMSPPTRVRDVLAMTEDAITYLIDPATRGDHKATWRILPAESP